MTMNTVLLNNNPTINNMKDDISRKVFHSTPSVKLKSSCMEAFKDHFYISVNDNRAPEPIALVKNSHLV